MKKIPMEKKYLFALYSNIALLNALSYVQINQKNFKIKEKNLEDHFKLNNSWENLVIRINKRKKENNIKIENTELAKMLAQYLRLMRNRFSHSKNYYKEEKGKIIESFDINKKKFEKLETNEEFKDYFKQVLENMNFTLSYHADKDEKRLFFIMLFLNKSELIDLKKDLENNFKNAFSKIISILNYGQTHLKYGFKNYKYQTHKAIHHKVLNYLKTFNDVKDHKMAFLNLARDLLNYKLKDDNFIFEKNVFENTDESNQGLNEAQVIKQRRYFLQVKILCDKNPNKCKLKEDLDFASTKFLMLLGDKKKIKGLFYKVMNKIKASESSPALKTFTKQAAASNVSDDYQAFQKRYSNSSLIPIRHLLKTLNRVNTIFKEEQIEDFVLKQKHFEMLYQALKLQNLRLLDQEVQKFLNKFLIFDFANGSYEALIMVINSYILKKVNSEEKFVTLFTSYQESKQSTTVPKPKFYLHVKFLTDLIAKKENPFDSRLFNFTNWKTLKHEEKKEANKQKNYLAPIIMFYLNNFSERKKYRILDNDFYKQFEILEIDKLKYIFAKRLPFEQKDIVIKDSVTKQEYQINHFTLESVHAIVNNKLFIEFKKLLKVTDINLEKWNKIQKLIAEHRANELTMVKQVFNDDMESENQKRIRNAIIHRTMYDKDKISGFIDIKEYQKQKTLLLKTFKKMTLPLALDKSKTGPNNFEDEANMIEKFNNKENESDD